MIQDWNIKTRGHECAKCAKPFDDGDNCVSELKFAKDENGQEEFVRTDYCRDCWEAEQRDESEGISVWRGQYKAPPPPEPDPTPKQTVETLLRGLIEGDSAVEHQTEIYLLAVMLERKRILIERGSRPQEDGTILRVYEFCKTGEALLVTDPCLQLNQLDAARDRIVALMDGGAEKAQDAGIGDASPSTEATEKKENPQAQADEQV